MNLMFLILLIVYAGSVYGIDVTINYEVKEQGQVSIGIYDEQGSMVRTLQSGKKQDTGKYEIVWDGKDNVGNEVKPGIYKYKGISSNIKSVYEFVAGNPNKIPYKTSDGKGAWSSFYGNAMGLVSDDTGIYIQYSMEEGDGSLIKVDSDGNIKWKAHGWQGDGSGYQIAICTDKKYVYIAGDVGVGGDWSSKNHRAVIWRVESETGDYALWNNHGILPGKPFECKKPVIFWEFYNGPKDTPPVAIDTNVRGLAVGDGKLYVPLYRENKIEIYNTEKAELISTIENIPKPSGICIDDENNLYVVSEKQILKISPDRNTINPIITKNLSAPFGITVDKEGNIHITDLGELQQVKKFSSNGKLLLTIGKKGGRPFSGKMESENFLFPTGITVDKEGKIYVGEDSPPRRVVILNKSGKIINEWIGPIGVGAGLGITVDEENPEYVYTLYASFTHQAADFPLIRFKVDYDKKSWKVDAYWWGLTSESPLRTRLGLLSPRMINYGSCKYYIRHFKGNTYLFSGMHWAHPIWKIEGYNIRPSACVGNADQWLPVDLKTGYNVDWDGNASIKNTWQNLSCWVWQDIDGNGEANENEVKFFDKPKGLKGHGCWGGYIDKQMNVYIPDSIGTGNLYKVPCLGIDEKGNPIYSWEKSEVVVKAEDNVLAEWDYGKLGQSESAGKMYKAYIERVYVDEDGAVYGTTTVSGKDKGIGWASSMLDAKIGRWNKGRMVWKTGKKAQGFNKPGEFYALSGIDGIVRDYIFFTDINGQSRIFTKDGLYAGSVPKDDAYRGKCFGDNVLLVELCGAQVFTESKTGKTYYMGGDETGVHFWSLEGLDKVQNFEDKIEVK